LDAPDIVISNRSNPICDVPAMKYGSKPTDGGNFLFTDEEKKAFIEKEPQSAEVVKPFLSAREFLNNKQRWCLWLVGISPAKLKTMPEVMKRVEQVRKFRAKSKAKSTRDYPYHTLFRQVTQPDSNYILVPLHTSENRKYIPFGFFGKEYIANNSCSTIPDATLYNFGVLTSQMHMAWVKYTCGRLKSDYRYSKDIVYNNYPWPKKPSKKQLTAVETASQGVLDARLKYPNSSLADLYDPLTMPPELVKTHNALDRAVDKCYRGIAFTSEIERLEYLFMLYNQYTEPLIVNKKTKKRRPSKRV